MHGAAITGYHTGDSLTVPQPPHLLLSSWSSPCLVSEESAYLGPPVCFSFTPVSCIYLILLHFSTCPQEAGSKFAHPECQTPVPSQALGPDRCVTSLATTLPQINTWAGTSIQYSTLRIQLLSQLQIHQTPALVQPTFHHLSHKETMKETVSPRLKSRPAMFMPFT